MEIPVIVTLSKYITSKRFFQLKTENILSSETYFPIKKSALCTLLKYKGRI